MKRCPSLVLPCTATNRLPGPTRRESSAICLILASLPPIIWASDIAVFEISAFRSISGVGLLVLTSLAPHQATDESKCNPQCSTQHGCLASAQKHARPILQFASGTEQH